MTQVRQNRGFGSEWERSAEMKKMLRLLAMLVLPAAMMLSQTPAAQDDQAPLIRTTTRLVQLNVVVLDSRNHPVTGLQKDDFRVFDNGAPQQIAHFTASQGEEAQPVAQSPLSISNRQVQGDEAPGATVILVDETLLDPQLLGIVPLDLRAPILQARLLVLDYLATIKPGQQVAIYAMRREGIVVIHDFTDDPTRLVEAAKSLGTPSHGKFVTVDDVLAASQTRTLHRWQQNPWLTDRLKGYGGAESLNMGPMGYGLQAVVKHLKGMPGRKNLVWISTSFPMASTRLDIVEMAGGRDANLAGNSRSGVASPNHPDPRDHFDEIRAIARSFGNANIAVYPIDAFGLTRDGSSEAQRAAANMIATESGGRIFFDTNGMVQNLQEIVAESSEAYQMGFYPGDKAWDGKYHHIELKLTPGHAGMKLLYRRGYLAADEPVDATSDRAFQEAARSVVEAPGIGLTLNVSSNPLEWGPEEVVLKLNMPDIQFEQRNNRAHASLDVAFVQLGKDGRVLEGFKDNLETAFPTETFTSLQQQGWFYPRQLFISGQTEKLRVVVRDLSTGAIGSVSVPVHPFSAKNAK